MSMKVELFFFPASFYSQKARLALEEKNIPYTEKYLSLKDNEQAKAWFLKINPKGEVPALRIGEKCYTESENIINVVDNLPSDSKEVLVPQANTAYAQTVHEWRAKLDAIPVPIMTFGVILNSDLTGDLSGIPAPFRMKPEAVKANLKKSIAEMEKEKSRNPGMADSYDKKIANIKQRLIDFFDRTKVSGVLKNVDVIMEEVEKQLSNVYTGNPSAMWLCGETFTAADITLCVLLGRFRLLGLSSRFVNPEKYPMLVMYWKRAQERPKVKKVVVDNMSEVKWFFLGRALRRYGGIVAGAGVLGAAIWFGYKYLKN